jgi:hypothetical protein
VLLLFALARPASTLPAHLGAQRMAGYAVGILASYWMFVRLLA